jgi:hypothetical protein
MRIDLISIPNALDTRLGLPRPDWTVIRDWTEQHVAEEALDDAWTQLAQQWLEQLQRALPANYGIAQSEEFLLLSAADSATNGRLLRWCESFREKILDTLEGVARDEGYGKHVVLAFHDWETYYDYVADFYPDTGEFALSGGIFLDCGYGHFAVSTRSDHQLDRTIAHELTHAMLRHLPLPLWLNEGVTQVVEDLLIGSSHFRMDPELALRHRSYWNEESIHSFWSGDSFYFPDDGQELSYSLAQVLFRNLASDYPRRILDFLGAARFSDAGDEALLAACGVSLADRAAQFLGPGNWRPRSDYGQIGE